MRQLTINQVLVYYDGPELVLGTDQVGTKHLGLHVGQGEGGGQYLAVAVSLETVLALLAGGKDLRAVFEAPETGDWFQFILKDDAGPVQLEGIAGGKPPESWLPDQGFEIPYIAGSDILLRETTERASAIIHLSLEPPEARQDYRITVTHLVDALQRFQSLVKHAYTKATAATRAASQAAAEATDSHGLDVFAVSEGRCWKQRIPIPIHIRNKMIDCYHFPNVCTPQVAIIAGAFLALSVFSGGIAAIVLLDKLHEFKQRRLYKLHQMRDEHERR